MKKRLILISGSPFTLAILLESPFPKDIIALGTDGIKRIWHDAKLRGRGYSRVDQIVKYAESSVGLNHGTDGSREAVKWFAGQIIELGNKLDEIESMKGEIF